MYAKPFERKLHAVHIVDSGVIRNVMKIESNGSLLDDCFEIALRL